MRAGTGAALPGAGRAGLVAAWCALWLVVGVWTGYEVWQLSALTSSVADSGRALDEAGSALQRLEQLPVVGDSTERLGTEVRVNAAGIVEGADAAGSSVRRLSVLLGLTVVLVPSVPAVVAHRRSSPAVRPVTER